MIPDLLWERAWRLGDAHGHEWTFAIRYATGLYVDDEATTAPPPPRPTSIGMVDAIVRQYREEWCSSPGVGSPFTVMTEGGYQVGREWVSGWSRFGATHRTRTGRCRWAIDHDGAVTISISRPGDVDVLVVTVAVDGTAQWTVPDCGVRYGARHVEAAVRELTALGVDATVPARIAEEAAFTDGAWGDLTASLAQIDHWEELAERFE